MLDNHARPLQKVSELAYQLLTQYDLADWQFCFDHARSRAGLCDYNKKTISMSRKFARSADDAQIKNTLLHEIAHALVGHAHGHDIVWRAKAMEIGCDAKRCHNSVFSTPKWVLTCPKGCFSTLRHRRKNNLVCGKCKTPVLFQLHNV
ncbi:SprT-like domain-containing protein [Alphaproteobacteria bacterium]|nr:transcription elongation protein SprT [Alphaproteobacteria bacterium]MDA9190138.1 SprT-like domain-containing protein [Alphaproteobacteria bacterium]MDC3311247.1 SprT-like domain-containing protein [Alphaproteobacteria bacterium]